MRNKICINRDDYISALHLIEKMLYIVHRAENRENADNRAYSMAITFAKENVQIKLNKLRMKLFKYLSDNEFDEIEPLFDDIDYNLPYDKTIEDLREELKPYLVTYTKLNGDSK